MDPLELAAATSQTLALNRRRHWSSARARCRRQFRCSAVSPRHPRVSGAAPHGEKRHAPFFFLYLAIPRVVLLAVAAVLFSAAACHRPASNPASRAHTRVLRCPRFLPGQPALETVPRQPFLASAGEPAAARRRPLAPPILNRPIEIQWSRLDLIRSQIDPYRSTMAFLQKSPSVFLKSTLGPS